MTSVGSHNSAVHEAGLPSRPRQCGQPGASAAGTEPGVWMVADDSMVRPSFSRKTQVSRSHTCLMASPKFISQVSRISLIIFFPRQGEENPSRLWKHEEYWMCTPNSPWRRPYKHMGNVNLKMKSKQKCMLLPSCKSAAETCLLFLWLLPHQHLQAHSKRLSLAQADRGLQVRGGSGARLGWAPGCGRGSSSLCLLTLES